jgi:hypothetical protein
MRSHPFTLWANCGSLIHEAHLDTTGVMNGLRQKTHNAFDDCRCSCRCRRKLSYHQFMMCLCLDSVRFHRMSLCCIQVAVGTLIMNRANLITPSIIPTGWLITELQRSIQTRIKTACCSGGKPCKVPTKTRRLSHACGPSGAVTFTCEKA